MPEPKGITGNNIEDLLRARAGAAPRGRVEWLPHADPDLRRVIDDGRLLVLIARNSGVSGKKSFLAAAQEAWDAAEDLKTTGGMDVTSLLPPVAALAEQLASTPFREQHRSRDGEVFPSRVVVVDQRRHGVVVVVTSSSAVKEDENLEQPHGKMVGWILRSLTPKVGAFFVKRVDRLSRTQLGFVPVFKELLDLYDDDLVWAADGRTGRWPLGQSWAAINLLLQSAQGASDAEILEGKRAAGMRNRTGSKFGRKLEDEVDREGDRAADRFGGVKFAVPVVPPIGLMVYTSNRTGRNVLTLEHPDFHPTPVEGSGNAQVFSENGERVNGVQNTVWLLKELAKGRSPTALWPEIVARRVSSPTLRKHWGLDAYFGGPMHKFSSPETQIAHNLVRTLRRNVDFYATGTWEIEYKGDTFTIEGLLPPDGPWITEREADLIREQLETRQSRASDLLVAVAWQNMSVTLNGREAELRRRKRNWEVDGVEYNVTPREGHGGEGARSAIVPDAALTNSMVAGLVAAEDVALTPFVGTGSDTGSETGSLTLQLNEVRRAKAAREAARQAGFDDMMEVDENGQRVLTHGARTALQARINKLSNEIEAMTAEIDSLRSASRSESLIGLSDDDVLTFVEGLRDPEANGYKAALKRGVRNLHFTVERRADRQLLGSVTSWTGDLVFYASPPPEPASDAVLDLASDAQSGAHDWVLFSVPFSGSHVAGALAEKDLRAAGVLKLLRSGTVSRNVRGGGLARSKGFAAEALGVGRSRFRAGMCPDPALLRLWMAIEHPDPAPCEDPADVPTLEEVMADQALIDDFGGTQALAMLVARMQELVRDDGSRSWLIPRGPKEVEAMVSSLAVARGGRPLAFSTIQRETLKGRLSEAGRLGRWDWSDPALPVVMPCRFCGEHAYVLMRFREAQGYVCADVRCRRDEAGVRWSTRFDKYVAHPRQFLRAGLDLDVDPDQSLEVLHSKADAGVASVLQRYGSARKVGDLAESEKDEIVAAYLAQVKSRTIRTQFRIADQTIYAILRERGVPTRGAAASVRSGPKKATARKRNTKKGAPSRAPSSAV